MSNVARNVLAHGLRLEHDAQFYLEEAGMGGTSPRFTGDNSSVWQLSRPLTEAQGRLNPVDHTISLATRAGRLLMTRPPLFGQSIMATQTGSTDGERARLIAIHDRSSLHMSRQALPPLGRVHDLRPYYLSVSEGGAGKAVMSSAMGDLLQRRALKLIDSFMAIGMDQLIKDSPEAKQSVANDQYRWLSRSLGALAASHERQPLDGTNYVFNLGNSLAAVLYGCDRTAWQQYFSDHAAPTAEDYEVLSVRLYDYAKGNIGEPVAGLLGGREQGNTSVSAIECYGHPYSTTWGTPPRELSDDARTSLLQLATTLSRNPEAAAVLAPQPFLQTWQERTKGYDRVGLAMAALPQITADLAPIGLL